MTFSKCVLEDTGIKNFCDYLKATHPDGTSSLVLGIITEFTSIKLSRQEQEVVLLINEVEIKDHELGGKLRAKLMGNLVLEFVNAHPEIGDLIALTPSNPFVNRSDEPSKSILTIGLHKEEEVILLKEKDAVPHNFSEFISLYTSTKPQTIKDQCLNNEKTQAKRVLSVSKSFNPLKISSLESMKEDYKKGKDRSQCIALVNQIIKHPGMTKKGKSTMIVTLIDESTDVKNEFRCHFFTSDDSILKLIKPGDILRLQKIQLELYKNIIDGRVFNNVDILLYKKESTDLKPIMTARKTLITEKEKRRVEELRRWYTRNELRLKKETDKMMEERLSKIIMMNRTTSDNENCRLSDEENEVLEPEKRDLNVKHNISICNDASKKIGAIHIPNEKELLENGNHELSKKTQATCAVESMRVKELSINLTNYHYDINEDQILMDAPIHNKNTNGDLSNYHAQISHPKDKSSNYDCDLRKSITSNCKPGPVKCNLNFANNEDQVNEYGERNKIVGNFQDKNHTKIRQFKNLDLPKSYSNGKESSMKHDRIRRGTRRSGKRKLFISGTDNLGLSSEEEGLQSRIGSPKHTPEPILTMESIREVVGPESNMVIRRLFEPHDSSSKKQIEKPLTQISPTEPDAKKKTPTVVLKRMNQCYETEENRKKLKTNVEPKRCNLKSLSSESGRESEDNSDIEIISEITKTDIVSHKKAYGRGISDNEVNTEGFLKYINRKGVFVDLTNEEDLARCSNQPATKMDMKSIIGVSGKDSQEDLDLSQDLSSSTDLFASPSIELQSDGFFDDSETTQVEALLGGPLQSPQDNECAALYAEKLLNRPGSPFHVQAYVTKIFPDPAQDNMLSFLRGYCNYCHFFSMLSELLWTDHPRSGKSVEPLCRYCVITRGRKIGLKLIFLVTFDLVSSDGCFIEGAILGHQDAEFFFGCSGEEFLKNKDLRKDLSDKMKHLLLDRNREDCGFSRPKDFYLKAKQKRVYIVETIL